MDRNCLAMLAVARNVATCSHHQPSASTPDGAGSARTQSTSLSIRNSQVLAAGSAHNVLSVVTYQSVSSRLKVYPDKHVSVYSWAVWHL